MDKVDISKYTACVIGCGGLGGFVIEELSRAGIKKLILFDGDSFDLSNLNRQLLSSNKTLGQNKAEVYKIHLQDTAKCEVVSIKENFTEKNAALIKDADIVLDCVDNIAARLFISKKCGELEKMLVHGAIDGEQGQVLICAPKCGMLERLYKEKTEIKHETVSYAVATVASVQVAVAVKVLTGNHEDLKNKIVLVDMDEISVKKFDF